VKELQYSEKYRMKRIIVTPAGRKEYLSILSKYLDFYKNEFDEWHLWCNTTKQSDIDYIYSLKDKYNYIKVIPLKEDYEWLPGGNAGIARGFRFEGGTPVYACTVSYFYRFCIDLNSSYLKLDDDIVFIKKNSIRNIFEYRENNKDNFLIFGNTINNVAMNYLHQKSGALIQTFGAIEFNSVDRLGLYNSDFVIFCHRNFFNKYKLNQIDIYNFEPFLLKDYTHVAIQAICWLGSELNKFQGILPLGANDENYLSVDKPIEIQKPNIILGDGLFCHYSSATVRSEIDKTDILFQYEKIADEYLS
jgi:hypothetical protein